MSQSQLLQKLTSRLPLGICVVDEFYQIIYWNEFFTDRLSTDNKSVTHENNLLVLFPDAAKFLQKKINSVFVLNNASFSYWEHRPHVFDFSSSRPITGEETAMYQNIEFFPLDIENNQVKTVCLIVQDVTELASYYQAQKCLSEQLEQEHTALSLLNKKLEAAQNQLLQSEKMAAIGQLAAGVAHEINNPIGFVNSNLQSLQDYNDKLLKLLSFYQKLVHKIGSPPYFALEQDMLKRHQFEFICSDLPDLINESIEGLDRVAVIVKSLKSFSHVDSSEWQYANVIEGIENTLKIAANQIKYKAVVLRNFQDNLPELYCQPMQLNQVFLNLLVNAAQAIEERGEISIDVSATESEFMIVIRDTGSGIAAQDIRKIFEPFYTTKPVGTGTGLGLSLSYSIVQKHKGEIKVTSTLGVGTSFTVILPILTPADVFEC
ncbi:GHKL domain-containing protein [Shewanella sp. DNRA4]|uniref:sensor histidine kinase n=1 Tax=Shewanella TaxID=22 RepID=UPI00146EE704|nr:MULTISPECIES: ATP-binding protein [Shewanella]MBW0281588.1 two-component sensor histidine kinase [Shewanella xiamenensis]MCT8870764.1 GHKL domain-containing protein [Shewanella xiamenensis]NMD52437.1 GHKL domain-containing protein [Shewanella sp. DNRA4]UWH40360.1 GHKL domain-containing protein [Shewanella xiamenensis]